MADDRNRVNELLLNDVSRDMATLTGLLLGKDGRGGCLSELRESIDMMRAENRTLMKELRDELTSLHAEHHREMGELRTAVATVRTDSDRAHGKIRDLEVWRTKQTKGWEKFLDHALKLILTLLGGVAMVWFSSMVARFLK